MNLRDTAARLSKPFLPVENLEAVREEFLGLIERAYTEIGVINSAFADKGAPELRIEANRAGELSTEADPHTAVESIAETFSTLRDLLLLFVLVLWGVAAFLSLALREVLRDILSATNDPFADFSFIIPIVVAGYFVLLKINTGILRAFNDELRISWQRISGERRKKRLAVYYIWNSMLNGQKVPTISLLLASADNLSNVPGFRWLGPRPSSRLIGTISDNLEVIFEGDSFLAIWWRIFEREW